MLEEQETVSPLGAEPGPVSPLGAEPGPVSPLGAEIDAAEVEGGAEIASAADLEADEQVALIEALLVANGEPISCARLSEIVDLDEARIGECLKAIDARLSEGRSGVELVCVADKYQLRTRALFAPFIRELKAGRPRRLSNPALETLAIVAYRQPIVKSDIERIRGVDVTPTLKTLLERRLIKIIGHQATVGQPALYGTTEDFLKLFGLGSLGELPTLRDLKEIANDPGESESPLAAGAGPESPLGLSAEALAKADAVPGAESSLSADEAP